MGIILWLIFGALVGWIASMIMRTDEQQGAVANIIIGIVGAFIGGFISRLVGGPAVGGFNLTSILVAVVGAVVLIGLIRMVTGRGTATHR